MEDYIDILILTGVIILASATIFTSRLFFKKSRLFKLQSVYLLFIIFHSVYAIVFRNSDFVFLNIGAPFSLFYAPFFYSCVLALIHGEEFRIKPMLIHFILGFIFLFVFIVFSIQMEVLKPYLNYYFITLYSCTCIQLVLYAVLTYLKFNKEIKDAKMISFMNQSVLIMIVSTLVFSGLILRDKSERLNYINGFLVYLIMLLIVIVIFRFNLIILQKKVRFYKKDHKEEFFAIGKKKTTKFGKYYKSKLSDKELERDIEVLNIVLNKEIYLQSDLTLEILAKKLKIPAHQLSQVFAKGLDSNFNKTINSYRIQYAIVLLQDTENKETIEEIGLRSGFNSRASFYRAFNATMNMTPSEYKKRLETDI